MVDVIAKPVELRDDADRCCNEGSPGSRAERRQVELVVTHPDQREGGGEETHRGESSAHKG
jgi:hypothetical protein